MDDKPGDLPAIEIREVVADESEQVFPPRSARSEVPSSWSACRNALEGTD
jgi:hypothetical protein